MVQSQSDSPRISFITSNKNKRLLAMNGYIYHLNKSTAKVTYWICEEKMCWASVHLDVNDQFLKYAASSYTHLPTPERQEVRLMISKVKERVTNETTSIGQIYNEEMARTSVSRSTLANAPSARGSEYVSIMCFASQRRVLCLRLRSQSCATTIHSEFAFFDELRHSVSLSANPRLWKIVACWSSATGQWKCCTTNDIILHRWTTATLIRLFSRTDGWNIWFMSP